MQSLMHACMCGICASIDRGRGMHARPAVVLSLCLLAVRRCHFEAKVQLSLLHFGNELGGVDDEEVICSGCMRSVE